LKKSSTHSNPLKENGTSGRPGQKVFVATLAACLALGLNGCLLNRMVEVQDQFCDFDSNFKLQFADSASFNFHSPVLLDQDILWIADASPTHMTRTADDLSMVFILEKTGSDNNPENQIRVELAFLKIDDQFKLASVMFDPKLNAVINPQMLDKASIDTATQTLCETGWSFGSTAVEMDLSGQDLDDMPKRAEILDWLGPPVEEDKESNSFTYEYQLKGDMPEPMTTRFTVWFDSAGEKPVRIDSEYSRFRTSTDLVGKTMSMKVKI
jgi:hypothetical protein